MGDEKSDNCYNCRLTVPFVSRIRIPLLPRWFRWVLVGGVATTIAVYSVVPLPSELRSLGIFGFFPLQKYLHFLAYAGMAGVLGYALLDSDRPDWIILLFVFALTVVYGIAMELLQLTLPHRHFSVQDILVNAAGTAIVVVIWRLLLLWGRFYRIGRTPSELQKIGQEP